MLAGLLLGRGLTLKLNMCINGKMLFFVVVPENGFVGEELSRYILSARELI